MKPALTLLILLCLGVTGPAVADSARVDGIAKALAATVSVLPVWPGLPQGGGPDIPDGAAPEGTGYAFDTAGHVVTAFHVVAKALSIDVRLPDGRIVPAVLVAGDGATDVAVLRIDEKMPPLADAPTPRAGEGVCAVGNAFGLDLSVTCGTVSAVNRAGMGFNAVEDFVQTDAAMNPGSSGGPLVTPDGRLAGLLSAIITKQSDTNIGVNFAVSARLVRRVAEDIIAHGSVRRAVSGMSFAPLPREMRDRAAGVVVRALRPNGPGAQAGFRTGDTVTAIAGRAVRKPQDAIAELYLRRPGERVTIAVERDGARLTLALVMGGLG